VPAHYNAVPTGRKFRELSQRLFLHEKGWCFMATRVLCVPVLIGTLLVFLPTLVSAQTSSYRGQGYVFFGPGAASNFGNTDGTFHVGGGGEVFLYRELAGGAEIGYLAPWKTAGDGIGVFSLDGSLHFDRTAKLTPFITAGYTRAGRANGINFGGGIEWWFRERKGLRLEFRDYRMGEATNLYYLDFRIGFEFR
jgi:hypothetical protein